MNRGLWLKSSNDSCEHGMCACICAATAVDQNKCLKFDMGWHSGVCDTCLKGVKTPLESGMRAATYTYTHDTDLNI